MLTKTLLGLTILAFPVLWAGEAKPVVVTANAIQPQVAIDAEGNVHVAFLQGGNVAVSMSRDRGETFTEPVVAMDVGGHARGGKQRGPRLGVDGRKRIFVTAPVTFDVAEQARKYPTTELYLVRSDDGGKTWSPPLQINQANKKAPEALHWLAVDPAGAVHAAWLDLRGRVTPGQDLYYAKIVDGKIGTNRKIATLVCECCAPGLAVDDLGRAVTAWREGGDKPSREILWAAIDGGDQLLKPRQLNTRPSNVPT